MATAIIEHLRDQLIVPTRLFLPTPCCFFLPSPLIQVCACTSTKFPSGSSTKIKRFIHLIHPLQHLASQGPLVSKLTLSFVAYNPNPSPTANPSSSRSSADAALRIVGFMPFKCACVAPRLGTAVPGYGNVVDATGSS